MAQPEAWGDVVLARKETPTSYHLSVVVDDALQGVTHVVRGQDLQARPSVHRVLQALLGLPAPIYHHHRLILDDGRRKLSKSTQATALRELRAAGRHARGHPPHDRPGVTPLPRHLALRNHDITPRRLAVQGCMACCGGLGRAMRRVKSAKTAAKRRRKATRPRRARLRVEVALAHARARDPHAAHRHPGAQRTDRGGRPARARAALGEAASRAPPSILAASHDADRRWRAR